VLKEQLAHKVLKVIPALKAQQVLKVP